MPFYQQPGEGLPPRRAPGTVDVSQLSRQLQGPANPLAFLQYRKPMTPVSKHRKPSERISLGESDEESEEGDITIPETVLRSMSACAPQTDESGNAFASLLLGREEPAKIISYWHARRIQNSVRRFLEHLEESHVVSKLQMKERGRYRAVNDSLRPQKQYEQLHSSIFTRILESVNRQAKDKSDAWLEEREFCDVCEKLKLWPSEMEPSDKVEVFSALMITSQKSGRNFRTLYGAKNLVWSQTNAVITQQTFCEGLSDVPFNLPDFPVPEYYFSQLEKKAPSPSGGSKIDVVAAVVALFLPQSDAFNSLNNMKDYFFSDLVSVEEIQVALPRLWPVKIVVDACTWIIRCAVPYFSSHQWESLVKDVRQKNYNDSMEAQAVHQHNTHGQDQAGEISPKSSPKEKVRRPPQTCPLPPREIDERPLQMFYPFRVKAQTKRLIDWSTVSEIAPADRGAGGQAPSKWATPTGATDVMWLSAELHPEIRGPFLYAAFAKCCELYNSRCDLQRRPQRRR